MIPKDGMVTIKNCKRIEVSTAILNSPEFMNMPDEDKWRLIGIALLAATRENKVPMAPDFLSIELKATTAVALGSLLNKGFIVPWSDVLSDDPCVPKKAALAEKFAEFMFHWNEMATGCGLQDKDSAATFNRKRSFSDRSREDGWMDIYPRAISMIPSSQFLIGNNEHKWKISVDWFLKPDKAHMIYEGKYHKNHAYTTSGNDGGAGKW